MGKRMQKDYFFAFPEDVKWAKCLKPGGKKIMQNESCQSVKEGIVGINDLKTNDKKIRGMNWYFCVVIKGKPTKQPHPCFGHFHSLKQRFRIYSKLKSLYQ